ncbi:MAG: hypothetical protein P1U56_12660 [Saprospiraceae bacterium]|nr:hypothetical protein [Saprospiraceae bacterium]
MENKVTLSLIMVILCISIVVYNINPNLSRRLLPPIPSCFESPQEKEIAKKNCLSQIDTTHQLPAFGCGNWFYSILDTERILQIRFPATDQFNTCSPFTIDSVFQQDLYLIKFPKGKAHLQNKCTCLINDSAPQPIESYKIVTGELIIAGSPSPKKTYNDLPLKTIWIDQAIFRSESGSIEKVENKLLYKVIDIGPIG